MPLSIHLQAKLKANLIRDTNYRIWQSMFRINVFFFGSLLSDRLWFVWFMSQRRISWRRNWSRTMTSHESSLHHLNYLSDQRWLNTLEVWTWAFTRKTLLLHIFVSSFSSYFSTCSSPWLLSPLLPCSICSWASFFSWLPLLLFRVWSNALLFSICLIKYLRIYKLNFSCHMLM